MDGDTLTQDQVEALAAAWEDLPAAQVVRLAAERFAPRLTFATGFGMEGCVLVDMIARQNLPVDIFTLDTGLLFPETYDLWRRLEARYGVRIRGVQPAETVEQQALSQGPNLWERDPDLCCERRKVIPLTKELSGFDAWITAIRRDQTPDRANARLIERDGKFGLLKVNPLAKWTTRDVWYYAKDNDVPINPLHDQGYPSIGCVPCTSSVLEGEDPRAGRWRGRTKTECGLHKLPVVNAGAER